MSTPEVVQQGHDEYAAKGRGLLTQMESFEIFFSLKLAFLIFSASEQFSTNLQAKDISEGAIGVRLLMAHYASLRTDETFASFYQGVLESSSGLTEEPVLPRYRKTPRKFQEEAQLHQYSSPKERYRQAYFQVLDHASGEIQRGFDQSDLSVVISLEKLLIDSTNGKEILEIPEAVAEYFREKNEKNVSRSKVQLGMLPDAIRTAFPASASNVKEVTNVRTIAGTLNESNIVKGMLGQIDKLLRAYLTFPVISTTAERSFSSLLRIKTFLRSTMTHHALKTYS